MTENNENLSILEKAKQQIASATGANNAENNASGAKVAEKPAEKPVETTNETSSAKSTSTSTLATSSSISSTVSSAAASTKESFNKITANIATKTNLKHNHVQYIVAGAAAAIVLIIVLIVLAFTIFNGSFVKGDIKSIALYPTKTTKDIDEQAVSQSTSFKQADNIMLKFNILPKNANESVSYTYQVIQVDKKDDAGNPTVVRKGSLPVQGDDTNTELTRYINIVSSAKTQLEPGTYEFVLNDNIEQVGKATFSVSAN